VDLLYVPINLFLLKHLEGRNTIGPRLEAQLQHLISLFVVSLLVLAS
jgi:hypothetical protein